MSDGKVHPPICKRCRKLYDPERGNKRIGEHVYTESGPGMCMECRAELFAVPPIGDRDIKIMEHI